jgi:hypothetical protein
MSQVQPTVKMIAVVPSVPPRFTWNPGEVSIQLNIVPMNLLSENTRNVLECHRPLVATNIDTYRVNRRYPIAASHFLAPLVDHISGLYSGQGNFGHISDGASHKDHTYCGEI